ncbi:DNA primase [Bifidobacterium goeldii]|uniref:DNA primase n=1 Tax=Bifidobacterium goeldii TaxID=2306975 RepID=A0A430FMG2_9BIFI|nr:DNA primase [Bifidobacterium goeldii]RSX53938.1 DNA primase [Bifidobacterium goeldii]
MALTVKRKRVDVDLILDQDTAERITQLGRDLTAVEQRHVTEGVNSEAKRIAGEIDELRASVAQDTIHLTLEALPLSQWRQVLEENTSVVDGQPKQRVEDITRDAIRLMTVKTVPDTPVNDIADIIGELSDGQISPIWYAIRDLNTRIADPKAALENASRILHA